MIRSGDTQYTLMRPDGQQYRAVLISLKKCPGEEISAKRTFSVTFFHLGILLLFFFSLFRSSRGSSTRSNARGSLICG